MAARSPARFLAPLALLAVVIALFLVLSNSSSDGGSDGSSATTTEEQPASTPTDDKDDAAGGDRKGPRFYRVKVGDTPSAIAEKTGVPLSQILELNPDLNPQALSPGERIKLRER